jgi:general secretion pathway protein C
VILLAASLAYWILQLYQPPQRPLAAAPVATMPDPSVEAAATLFGGQPVAATATNYQLTGVISAGRDSVAIIVADGTTAKALRVGRELAPGVTVAEVYPRYVMLSESGVMKRLDLATDTKAAAPMGGAPQANVQPGMQPGMLQGMQGSPPGAVMAPAMPVTPQQNVVAEPPMAPGAVMQQSQQQQQQQQQQPQQESEPPPANPNSAPPQDRRPTNPPPEQTTNVQ